MIHCPRCQQPLPEPPPRFCPNCGYDTQALGEPIVPGGPEVGGAYPPPPSSAAAPRRRASPGGGTPWERRQQIGFASALVETTQQVLGRPSDFFRRMPVTGGIGGPLLYGVIAGYVGLLASALYSFILRSALGSSLELRAGQRARSDHAHAEQRHGPGRCRSSSGPSGGGDRPLRRFRDRPRLPAARWAAPRAGSRPRSAWPPTAKRRW